LTRFIAGDVLFKPRDEFRKFYPIRHGGVLHEPAGRGNSLFCHRGGGEPRQNTSAVGYIILSYFINCRIYLTAPRQSDIVLNMLKKRLISDRSNGDTGRNAARRTCFFSDKAPQLQTQINSTL
jgi:hypothetical protein